MPLKLKLDLMDVLLNTKDKKRQKALASFVKRDAIKREFGNRVVDEIKRRTLSGKDKNGNAWSALGGARANKYSDQYKDSDEYKIYGKTGKVNLKLTGQMQASISVVGTGATTVTLGFVSSEQDKKATRHVMGDGVPVRDFWGIKMNEQTKILEGVISDFNADQEQTDLFEQLSDIATALSVTPNVTENDAGGRGSTVIDAAIVRNLIGEE